MHLSGIAAVIVAGTRAGALERARRARLLASRISSLRRRASLLWEFKSFIRESLLAILVSLLIVTLAGLFFGSLRDALISLPGLTLLVPGALAMRGNIFAALGARLGTALHTGELSSTARGAARLRDEVLATVVQTLIGSLFLAMAGRSIAIVLDIPTVTFAELAVCAVTGALAAGAVVLVVTVQVAMKAHKRGWDPDNVTAPVISSVADLVSMPSLLGAAYVVVWAPTWTVDLGLVVVMAVTLAITLWLAASDHRRSVEVLRASMPVLMAVILVIILPALVLEGMVEDLVDTPAILVLLPPFLAVAGNLGAVLASRLSSAAHLGLITMRGPPDALVWKNLAIIMVLAVLTFGALGVLVHVLSVATGLGSPGLLPLASVTLLGGLLITVAVSLAAYQVTAFTFRHGDDPDNVVIPVITSVMDALGTGLVVVLFLAVLV